MLQLFQHQDTRAFAEHEAVSVLIERPAGAAWVRHSSGQGFAAQSRLRRTVVIAASGAAGHHHVGIAPLNESKRIADTMIAGGASGHAQELGPLAPNRIATCPDARLMIVMGMKKGETRSGPFSCRTL